MTITNEIASFFNISNALVLPIGISAAIWVSAALLYFWWASKIKETEAILRKLIKSIEQPGMTGLESLESTIQTTKDHQLKSLLLETRDNLVEIEGDIGKVNLPLLDVPLSCSTMRPSVAVPRASFSQTALD